jgi:hypothetical protein
VRAGSPRSKIEDHGGEGEGEGEFDQCQRRPQRSWIDIKVLLHLSFTRFSLLPLS